MSDEQKIEQLLAAQEIMVLAVITEEGAPWVTPVAISRRDGLSYFEWVSAITSIHSQALIGHPDAAVTIYQKAEGSQIGYYAKGRAELVEEYKPGLGRYRFTAEEAWINDETFKKRRLELS